MEWIEIIGLVLSAVLALGGGWVGYVIKGAKATKEIGELLSVAGRALEDKKITKEEIAQILKEFNDVKEVIAAFNAAKKQ